MCDFMYRDSEIQMDTHLILYIEEHDIKEDFNSIDNKIFIGWDNETQRFYVRGKRQNISDKDFAPYALYYSSADKLYDFIEFVIGTTSTTSLVLYNFNNIKRLLLEDLTYDYLESLIDKNYEIAGYDRVKLKRKRFNKCLSMLC
jgi:hypothetical protein